MNHDEAIALCAYKDEADLTDEERDVRRIEVQKCQVFTRFLRWCKIVEPPTQTNPGGLIPFELWSHIKVIIDALLRHRLLSICKSRQVGASYTITNYVLQHVSSRLGSTWELFSKGEDEAIELLAKAQRTYNHLPPFLKLHPDPNSSEKFGFPTKKSRIIAHSSTESAGISFTASGIVWDEHEQHPFAAENFNFAKPAIDSVNGQIISIFTVDKKRPQTLAKSLFRNGQIFVWNTERKLLIPEPKGKWGSGENGFVSLFFPYDCVPGRDEAWYEDKKHNLTVEDIQDLTPELYMEQNYPRSLEEALSIMGTLAVFDAKVLNEMMGDTHNPISVEGVDPEIVHIYQDFHIGEYYIAATDTSHGVGKDDSVTFVMNVKTGVFVAVIKHNLLSPEELALHSVAMLSIYHNPLWYIECNDRGALTISTAQRLGYKHFGYHDEKKTKIGFNTTGYRTKSGVKGTRTEMLGAYVSAVNNHQVTMFNSDCVAQHYDIIRRADSEGRIEAAGGKKDDCIITAAICWAKKDEVQTGIISMKPIKTLDFPMIRR